MHRLTLLAALVHPRQVRDAVRPPRGAGPSTRRLVDGAVRCGLSVTLALALVAATGRLDLAGYAALGALASLYGRSDPAPWRARVGTLAGVGLVAAVVVMSALQAAGAPTVVVLTTLTLLAAGASAGTVALRTGPPGATILVFAAGAGSAPVTGGTSEVLLRGAAAVAGALVAWLVANAGSTLRRVRQGPAHTHTPAPGDRAPAVRDVLRAGSADGAPLAAALRVGVAGAVAGAVATVAGWGHPAWAVMGAAAVLQGAHVRHIGVRALQRAAGTAVGAAIALPLLGADLPFLAVAALVVVLQTVTELVVARHYGAAMLTITPMALLMTSIGGAPDPTALAVDRALDTVLGAVVALVVAVAAARPEPAATAPATSELDALQHLRDEGRDGRPLGAGQRDVGEQRVALERLDDRGDAVVPPDAQVVALGDVVRQHHA